jgi:hypothetical protein
MIDTFLSRIRGYRFSRLVGTTALAVVWGVLLLGVAVPSWRTVREQHADIRVLERQLADLDHWTVAGLWLEPIVRAQEPVLTAAWERRFPPERAREQLFLDMAQLADRCGLRRFQLEEIENFGTIDVGTWSTTDDEDGPPTDVPAGAPQLAPVRIDMNPYLIRTTFVADYSRTAAFLGGLERIDRVIDVRRLAIRPDRVGIEVDIELEVPVSEAVSS